MSALDPPPLMPLNPVANLFLPDDEMVAANVPKRFIFNVAGELFAIEAGVQQMPTRLLNEPWFQANQVALYDSSGNGN